MPRLLPCVLRTSWSLSLEAARKEVALYMEKEEDVLSYALFGQVALKYLKERESRKYNVDFELAEKPNRAVIPYSRRYLGETVYLLPLLIASIYVKLKQQREG